MKSTTYFLGIASGAVLMLFTNTFVNAQVHWSANEVVCANAGGPTEVKMGFNNAHAVASIGTRRFVTWMRLDSLCVSWSEGGSTAWSLPHLVFRGASTMNLPTIAATSTGNFVLVGTTRKA
ncbi:MAG: hypothetical protein RML40_03400 [Bacteroidota bacterium]|nr:hypothetical protein [Candidatus Kapabacteria bacterium]MDW8219557.1 hypothetical protein [Bacteroidota bacterium]